MFAAYQKPLHGPLAVAAIGIDRIRAVCPHFHQWLGRLEARWVTIDNWFSAAEARLPTLEPSLGWRGCFG